MREWAMYYVDFLRQFFSNLWAFIKTIFQALIDLFYTNAIDYLNQFVQRTARFTVVDWLAYVLVFLINIAFITLFVLRIIQAIKKNKK